MVLIAIVTGAYKPTYILGASHCTLHKPQGWGFIMIHPKETHGGFGFFATVTGVFGYGAMLEGFFATGNARGFIATVQKVFLRRLGMFFATVNE